MLYWVFPDRTMKWIDLPGSIVLDLARQPGVDLGRLDWLDADRAAEDDVVRVALRYGIPSSRGIVVAARHVAPVRRPAEMRKLFRESAVTMAGTKDQLQANDELMEALMSGWKESGERLDREIEVSLAESLREADRDAAREISE